MLPPELEAEIVTLPETGEHTIVVVTGNALRHRRFAYRMIEEFGDRVIGWYELDSTVTPKEPAPSSDGPAPRTQKTVSTREKVIARLKDFPLLFRRYTLSTAAKKVVNLLDDAWYRLFILRDMGAAMRKAEERLFAEEVARIREKVDRTPVRIHPSDVHSQWFLEEIGRLDPYFFLTLSGPLYRKPLLESIRGAAINQHAGHSPLYKGSNTIHWALYHRDLGHVGSTVHLTGTGADDGAILRRSHPTLFPDDDVHTVFLRTVALGTELMIESVREIMADKHVRIFRQPEGVGRTYLNREYNLPVMKAIFRDFRSGWLPTELNRRREF